jgi:hypothetical protein
MRTRHLVPALALIAAAPLAAQGLPSPSPSTTRPDSAGGMSSGSSWQQDTTRTKAKKDSAARRDSAGGRSKSDSAMKRPPAAGAPASPKRD